MILVRGDVIELLDRPELSLIGEDAKLWVEEDMLVWIWSIARDNIVTNRLDALRIPIP